MVFGKFFQKIYAPEIERLTLERDFFRARCLEETSEKKFVQSENKHLVNRLLSAANISTLPLPEKSPIRVLELQLSKEDLDILDERAKEYCEAEYGAEYTKDDFDRVFALMKASPAEWLTN